MFLCAVNKIPFGMFALVILHNPNYLTPNIFSAKQRDQRLLDYMYLGTMVLRAPNRICWDRISSPDMSLSDGHMPLGFMPMLNLLVLLDPPSSLVSFLTSSSLVCLFTSSSFISFLKFSTCLLSSFHKRLSLKGLIRCPG